jgi:S1/P1 Nuclease
MNGRMMAFALAIGTATFAHSAQAWDSEGHMIVAAVAWNDLSDASRVRVSQLLKLNPDYGNWIKGVTPEQQDQIAFVTAATWPDAIKSEKDYTFDGDRPSGPEAAQNIGYSDHLQHRYWHFIDIPLSTDNTPLIQPVPPNAETQIELFEAAIGSATVSDNVKSYDLVWLEHMVGDVHQPLHATSRFSQRLPNGDQGGNLVTLCAAPCRNELHAFWDNVLGTSKNPAAAIAVAGHLTAAPAAQAGIADEKVWIQESFAAAKQYAYASPIGQGAGPFVLDARYKQAARTEAQKRVALAGARLANLINTDLR